MDQTAKLKLGQRLTRRVKTGRGVRQGCCWLPILSNLYSEHFTKDALGGFGDSKIRAQAIHTVKYADDLVLLAEKQVVLQGMIERQIIDYYLKSDKNKLDFKIQN